MQIKALTDDWLNNALEQRRGGAYVTNFLVENIGDGVGFGGTVLRIDLEYSKICDAPASAILKLPVIAPAMLEAVKAQGLFREAMFYQTFAQTLPASLKQCLPEIYHVEIHPGAQDFAILMEDLGEPDADSNAGGMSPELDNLIKAVKSIGQFHAAFWNKPLMEDPETSWLTPVIDSNADSRRGHLESLANAMGHIKASEINNGYLMNCIQRLVTLIPLAPDQTPQGLPTTLTHGDFHPGNIFIRNEQVKIFDWQLVSQGSPLLDVANFLASSVAPADHERYTPNLLRAYHDTLLEEGVSDYSMAKLRKDLKQARFFVFLKFLIIFGTVSYDGPDGAQIKLEKIRKLIFLAEQAGALMFLRRLRVLFFVLSAGGLFKKGSPATSTPFRLP